MNKTIFALLLLLSPLLLHCSMQAQSTYVPGDVVPDSVVQRRGWQSFFCSSMLTDSIFSIMDGKSYSPQCTTPRSSLRYLRCLHTDIDGRTLVGEMVVNQQIADVVLDILRQLYRARYPIERMLLVDHWDADDERAMRANNSSAFNFRLISHTRLVSKHGLGMAVDINPLYNPSHKRLRSGAEVTEPATGAPYVDRSRSFPYKIERGDLCHRLFTAAGFRWGGDWRSSKDYQHFEK